MPLSLSNRDQNSGHLFYNRRLRAATTRFSVRMKHDDRKQTAALALSMVLVAIAAGWMMLLNVLKPTGIVGDSAIIGDRDSGALYARIDGRLYPALNLTSARLATGTAGQPTWVKPAEIAKYPTGPLVGIPGAPAAMPVNRGAVSAWAVCDTGGTPAQRGQAGGHLDRGPDHRRWPRHTPARRRRAAGDFRRQHLRDLGWQTLTDRSDQQGGHLELGARPRRDITNTDLTGALRRAARDRAAAGASGARGGHPVDVGAGRSGGIGVAGPNRRRGQPVLCAAADGVQKISSFVADLLRSANSYGAAARGW